MRLLCLGRRLLDLVFRLRVWWIFCLYRNYIRNFVQYAGSIHFFVNLDWRNTVASWPWALLRISACQRPWWVPDCCFWRTMLHKFNVISLNKHIWYPWARPNTIPGSPIFIPANNPSSNLILLLRHIGSRTWYFRLHPQIIILMFEFHFVSEPKLCRSLSHHTRVLARSWETLVFVSGLFFGTREGNNRPCFAHLGQILVVGCWSRARLHFILGVGVSEGELWVAG